MRKRQLMISLLLLMLSSSFAQKIIWSSKVEGSNYGSGVPETLKPGFSPMAGAVKAEDSKGKRLDEKRESPAELHYKFQPLKSQQVIIVENFNPGAITKVEIGREGKGARKEIYTAVAKVIIEKYRVLNLTFPLTEYEVTDVWINVDFKKIPRCGPVRFERALYTKN